MTPTRSRSCWSYARPSASTNFPRKTRLRTLRGGRSPRTWEGSSADDLGRGHRPAGHSGRGDGGTGTQTTLSAETTHVRVFYVFHPHHGLSLRVVRRPALGDGAVCVIEPTGRRLKIPRWMVSPDCPDPIIVERAHLSQDALLSLTALLATHVGAEGPGHGTLPHANDDGGKGGHRAGTTTHGPDEATRGGARTNRRHHTHSIGRSHGPHSRGGISRDRKER